MAQQKATGIKATKRIIEWVKKTMGPLTHTEYDNTNEKLINTTRADDSTNELELKKEILDLVYPVGSIYRSTVNKSPATFLGGSWTRIQDRFLIGESDDFAPRSTGGAKEVTLLRKNLPNITPSSKDSTTEGNHSHQVYAEYGGSHDLTWGSYQQFAGVSAGTRTEITYPIKKSGDHTHKFELNNYATQSTVTNLPPYYAVYMWRRTA